MISPFLPKAYRLLGKYFVHRAEFVESPADRFDDAIAHFKRLPYLRKGALRSLPGRHSAILSRGARAIGLLAQLRYGLAMPLDAISRE